MLAHTLGNPFDLDGDHAPSRRARPLADRGLLRRARAPTYPTGASVVGTFGDLAHAQLLSRPTTSRWAKAARCCHQPPRLEARSPSRSATGAATAGARRARTTPAASASAGSSATCRTATTTSTPTRTSATTSRSPTCRRHAGSRSWTASDGFIAARKHNFAYLKRPARFGRRIPDPARGHSRIPTRRGSGSRSRSRGGADRPRRAAHVTSTSTRSAPACSSPATSPASRR